MTGTGVKEVHDVTLMERTRTKKGKPVRVSNAAPSLSRKLRGIIRIKDPAVIEEIAQSDLLG